MSKLAQNFAKYVIHAKMQAEGTVEKPDIIGAIFGQTEGLLGDDLDLRELQRTGRIGRIEVKMKTLEGKTSAEIIIPSSLDASETSLIAASLETIDKVGPCEAKISVENMEDVRSSKRRYLVNRAKEILQASSENGLPDSQQLTEMIKSAVRTYEVGDYNGLSCGPDIEDSEEIIVVEGRADVINLLKNGIKNVIAIEGSKIPDAVIQLTKEKITTAFLDGDRGGDLDLKKLLAVADIDYVARAEHGKEVEELTKKEIYKALRKKLSTEKINTAILKNIKEVEKKSLQLTSADKKKFKDLLTSLTGSRAVIVLDNKNKELQKIPLSELGTFLDSNPNVTGIVFDGKINQALVDVALQKKLKILVGTDYSEKVKAPSTLNILTTKDL
jgi:DNA primase